LRLASIEAIKGLLPLVGIELTSPTELHAAGLGTLSPLAGAGHDEDRSNSARRPKASQHQLAVRRGRALSHSEPLSGRYSVLRRRLVSADFATMAPIYRKMLRSHSAVPAHARSLGLRPHR
jgi:hypothetical protein